MYRIAVDAMGGDNAPAEVIKGAIRAIDSIEDIELTLIGQEEVVTSLLGEYANHDRIKIINTRQVITNNEHPVMALRRKRDSSVVVGLNLVKNKEVDGFISAGSTGAVLAGAQLIVRPMHGIRRCALAPILPSTEGPFVLIDCGANVDSKPEDLVQYAVMGSIYAEIMGFGQRVGLINIGAEAEKGNELTKNAYKLLEKAPINFVGNVEAREIPFGEADVLVCDAFVGNVVLKLMEGTAAAFTGMLKEQLMSKTIYKLGALLQKGAFKSFKKKMDYSEYGGAPMLGVDGCIIKTHGSSDENGFFVTIRQARNYIAADVTGKIRDKMSAWQAEQNKAEESEN